MEKLLVSGNFLGRVTADKVDAMMTAAFHRVSGLKVGVKPYGKTYGNPSRVAAGPCPIARSCAGCGTSGNPAQSYLSFLLQAYWDSLSSERQIIKLPHACRAGLGCYFFG